MGHLQQACLAWEYQNQSFRLRLEGLFVPASACAFAHPFSLVGPCRVCSSLQGSHEPAGPGSEEVTAKAELVGVLWVPWGPSEYGGTAGTQGEPEKTFMKGLSFRLRSEHVCCTPSRPASWEAAYNVCVHYFSYRTPLSVRESPRIPPHIRWLPSGQP